MAGDGDFDGDEDGLIDRQEFAIAAEQPDNGMDHPSDAPLLHEDGDLQQPTEKAQRVFNILISKETRGKRLLADFNAWQQGEPPNAFIEAVLGMSDPTIPDTDGDGMYDGFEYWFTSWDLDQNRWSINPLIDGDVNLDSDGDSFDCNGDGEIDANETFSNLREWESRTWGKFLNRNTVPASLGIIDFGEDAMAAYQEELGFNPIQAQQALYQDFIKKGQSSVDRMDMINSVESENFNRSLRGVADPTHPDSDSDGFPMAGSIATPSTVWTTRRPSITGPPTFEPWDVDYDGDRDGWYDRTSFDIPARQGTWDDRVFTPSGVVVQNGVGDLPFTNFMEYDNQTRPDLNDSDEDSRTFITTVENGAVVSHVRDYNYSDGREVFKYGSNRATTTPTGTCCPTGTNTRWVGTKATTISVRTSTSEWYGSTLRPAARARPTPTPVCSFRRTARVERSLDPTRSSPGSHWTLLTPTTPTKTSTRTAIGTARERVAATRRTPISRSSTPSPPASTPLQTPCGSAG